MCNITVYDPGGCAKACGWFASQSTVGLHRRAPSGQSDVAWAGRLVCHNRTDLRHTPDVTASDCARREQSPAPAPSARRRNGGADGRPSQGCRLQWPDSENPMKVALSDLSISKLAALFAGAPSRRLPGRCPPLEPVPPPLPDPGRAEPEPGLPFFPQTARASKAKPWPRA